MSSNTFVISFPGASTAEANRYTGSLIDAGILTLHGQQNHLLLIK